MPRLPLSDHDYLAKLQDYYARHQVFPSYAAIGKIVGLKSTSSVSAFLERLKADGYLEAKDRRLRPDQRLPSGAGKCCRTPLERTDGGRRHVRDRG